MNDLSGLDWTSPVNHPIVPTSSISKASKSSSAPGIQTSGNIDSKTASPSVGDSFANLLRAPQKQSNGLSLQERQNLLLQERSKKAQQIDSHFGMLSALADVGAGQSKVDPHGSKLAPPSKLLAPQSISPISNTIDALARFNPSIKHDVSNHVLHTHTIAPSSPMPDRLASSTIALTDDDDDPFGLNQLPSRSISNTTAFISSANDDDDILGMLGRPADEVVAAMRKLEQHQEPMTSQLSHPNSDDQYTSPTDRAVAELVDMGFPASKAAVALAQTDSGCDVQNAVGILLQQAHDDARKKTPAPHQSSQGRVPRETRIEHGSSRKEALHETIPPWMRSNDTSSRSSSRTRNHTQDGTTDKEVSQYASELGTSLLKSANSFWKTSQKKVQRAMADMQQEPDASQPKWMRDARLAESRTVASKAKIHNITNEALALEPSSDKSKQQTSAQTHGEQPLPSSNTPFQRRTNGLVSQPGPTNVQTRPLIQQQIPVVSAEAYISPARRRKVQATGPSDTLHQSTLAPPLKQKSPLASPPIQLEHPSLKTLSRPSNLVANAIPARQIPSVSPLVLAASASHRQQGTELFKRGDFPNAYISYTSALDSLPSSHPINIVIFCNRALTNIKNGDPKAAIADADLALNIIGPSKGEAETINIGAGEGEKSMKEFYGKAIMRKAEALENLERWSDAARSWRDAVHSGMGGSISIQGRNRCEKALSGHSSQSYPDPTQIHTTNPPKQKTAPKLYSAQIHSSTTQSAEAVRKLRQANAAAERVDDEKFALTDQVDAKLLAWKGSKADNLRALISSLDKALWPEAGWTKVGMQDLIIPAKVKIIYMKAIAKVHPDKISQNATTEQRMLSAAIFATLNQAWDKFKIENRL